MQRNVAIQASLFTIDQIKQSKYLSTGKQIYTMLYTDKMVYYLALKRNKPLKLAASWMKVSLPYVKCRHRK